MRLDTGMVNLIKLCLALLCLSAAVFPAFAQADVQTIDFDTAPPALGSPVDRVGDVSFPLNLGFRPYRTEVGLRAHSGTTVADLGRCSEEVEARGGDPISCEFFQALTTGALARTARSVTLFAGRFGPATPFDPPLQATLTAFSAGGAQLATTGPIAINANGFNTRLSVSSANGNIARFTVKATSGPNAEVEAGDLGIDDVTVNFADGGAPDFTVSAPNQVLALVQGQSVEVPVQINRLNGSAGPVALSVTGLPNGVSAAPVTIPRNQSAATIVLNAAPGAPDTNFLPAEATITATPEDANVAPAPRTARLLVRVAKEFELRLGGFPSIEVPDCAPVDVPLKVIRDIAFNRDVTLSLRGPADGVELRPGLSGEFMPGSVVAPGGALAAERALRLTLDPNLSGGFHFAAIEGKVEGGSSQVLPIQVSRAQPRATIGTSTPGSASGLTSRAGKPGTTVRVTGTGFCPGTQVLVGNGFAIAPAKLVDPHTIEFTVPRHATTGPVTIIPRDGDRFAYSTTDRLVVDSFRNVKGFAFENPRTDSISFDELVTAFGKDDLFFKVNPCWPFADCSVPTGALDPLALVKWKVIESFMTAHCFGMSLATQQLGTKKYPYRHYADQGRGGASSPFEMSGPDGPGKALESFLDAEQMKTASGEVMEAWANRALSLDRQLSLIRREFSQNHKPFLSMAAKRSDDPSTPEDESDEGRHAVVVYDMEETASTADIHIYDSNKPFLADEDRFGATHKSELDLSVIHVDKVAETWSYDFTAGERWSGGNGGSLWVVPYSALADDNLSLPGVTALGEGLHSLLFDPSDGTAETIEASPQAEFMARVDGALESEGAGTWVSRNPDRPLEVKVLGTGKGAYTQAYMAPGFVAAATDVPTAKGVRDTVKGVDDSLTFESGKDRPLTIDLAQSSGASMSTAATLETHASANGTDSAGFSADSALTYAHDGAPTTVEFTLTTVRRNGGPATFISGPVPVGRGDRFWAEPVDRDLRRVKLTVRDARGGKITRVLRNKGRSQGRLKLGTAKISKQRLAMRVRLSGLQSRAVVGASLRLVRDGRVLARKAVALRGSNDTRKISWRLPRSLRGGQYRLVVDARAVTVATRASTSAGSVRAHRAAGVWLGR